MATEGDVLADRYRLVRRIGRGPHGEVFEAEQIGLDRFVAIKIVTSEIDRIRLAGEAQKATRLDARFVVRVLEAHLDHDPPFVVSELARGVSLAALTVRPIAEERATTIVRSLLDALSFAHENGIFHGDLRPSNIFVGDTGVQIGDFGFAIDDTDEGRTATDLLSAKSVVGYRAPERIRGGKPDVRSDIFAVGVCLFEMLKGRRPFEAGAPVDEIAAILREPTPQLRAHCSDVVARALDKDPAARFASAQAMKAALGRRRLLPWLVVTAIAIPIAIAVWAALTLGRIEREHANDPVRDASVAVAPSAVASAVPEPSAEPVPTASAVPTTSAAPAVVDPTERPHHFKWSLANTVGCPTDDDDKRLVRSFEAEYDACTKVADVHLGDRYKMTWENTLESHVGRVSGDSAGATPAGVTCLESAAAPILLNGNRQHCVVTFTAVR